MKYVVSFLRSPIGFVFNLAAHLPSALFNPAAPFICWGCETFCARDGVQDDCWW